MSMLQGFRDGTTFQLRQRRYNVRRRNAWLSWFLAVVYGFAETAYFGWNLFPKSGAEMACDGIALLLLVVACNSIVETGIESNGG